MESAWMPQLQETNKHMEKMAPAVPVTTTTISQHAKGMKNPSKINHYMANYIYI